VRLLFVCTGNVCRSPLAERLALAWARKSLGGAVAGLELLSAGLQAPEGRPMDPRSAAVLTRLGGDPAGARATPFVPAVAETADLVLTMTRAQRRAVLETVPRGLRRTFTLLEAADLMDGVDLRGLEHLPLDDRARELAARLDARRAHRTSTREDNIEDPIGRDAAVHEQVGDTIAAALRPLAAVLFLKTAAPDARHRRAA
jgi:protein-tyrosine phosphatase